MSCPPILTCPVTIVRSSMFSESWGTVLEKMHLQVHQDNNYVPAG